MSAPTASGRLAGKVAFVTGGTSGIGRAIALRYAREGARVIVASRQPNPYEGGDPTHELIRKQGGVAEFAALDVCDTPAVDRAVDAAVKRFGALHIMACSAGAIGPMGDSREVDIDEFDKCFEINVRALFACVRAALRYFVPAGYGKVVAISSNFGTVGLPQLAAYCGAKAAAINMIRALAAEYGKSGVNINVLCPGSTKTELSAPLHRIKEIRESFQAATPLRIRDNAYQAEPDDIADAALFLASDESRFITGSALIVDGGWTAL
ncbi:MAG TPA: glucose 1-dehydrogenase [Candidatus Binataceae bacterium]|nr:glucose 1-dehydrogenase [Candidatus Binataceae bacterium]